MPNCCQRGCKEEFNYSNIRLDHERPELFVTSQWHSTSSGSKYVYVLYRVVVALFWCIIIILSGMDDGTVKWFIYLTNWGLLILTSDVIIQASIAVYAAIRTVKYAPPFLKMTWYLKMQWVMANMSVGAEVLIGITYWILLYSPGEKVDYIGINTHGTTMIYHVVNIFITAMPVRIYHIFQTFIFAMLYILLSGIYWAAGGTNELGESYIYSELDWSDPGSAGLISFFLGFIGVIVVWLVIYGLYRVRLVIYGAIIKQRSKSQFKAGVRQSHGVMVRIQDSTYATYNIGIQDPAYVVYDTQILNPTYKTQNMVVINPTHPTYKMEEINSAYNMGVINRDHPTYNMGVINPAYATNNMDSFLRSMPLITWGFENM